MGALAVEAERVHNPRVMHPTVGFLGASVLVGWGGVQNANLCNWLRGYRGISRMRIAAASLIVNHHSQCYNNGEATNSSRD